MLKNTGSGRLSLVRLTKVEKKINEIICEYTQNDYSKF